MSDDDYTRPTRYPYDDSHLVVDLLTQSAYSRNGQPTRTSDHMAYFPEDEWHEAIAELLDYGWSQRMAAAVLLSKAARWASDSEAVLHEYVKENHEGHVDPVDPFVTVEELNRAIEQAEHVGPIWRKGKRHVTFFKGRLHWTNRPLTNDPVYLPPIPTFPTLIAAQTYLRRCADIASELLNRQMLEPVTPLDVPELR